MRTLLLPLAACAALAGCVGYGDVGYGYGSYGYGYGYPGYYGYGGPSATIVAPVYRDYHYYGNDRRMRDRDRDGIPNRLDRDRDGDGVRNRDDARPNNPRRR